MTPRTVEQIETIILQDVVKRYLDLRQSTGRTDLLIKFRGEPAFQAIRNLVDQNILRRKNANVATEDEEYLPRAAAFQFCGDAQLRDRAKLAATVVLDALQNMFVGERRKGLLVFQDLENHVAYLHPNQIFNTATLKLGLYLCRDLDALSTSRLNAPDETEVESFRIGESVIGMADPNGEWDRVMAGFRPSVQESATKRRAWNQIERLGGGGQSDVFLVWSPVDEATRADVADAVSSCVIRESLRGLGAMKKFKIREGDDEQHALDRLKQEIHVLRQNRPGLPKLFDVNESDRWIVTEYFARGTVEDNLSLYKGKPAVALKALCPW